MRSSWNAPQWLTDGEHGVTTACNGAGGRVGFGINASRAGPLMRVVRLDRTNDFSGLNKHVSAKIVRKFYAQHAVPQGDRRLEICRREVRLDATARYIPSQLAFEWEARKSDVPAFDFRECPKGLIKSLPKPEVPFGLYLRASKIADNAMPEICECKMLSMLDIAGTGITDKAIDYVVRIESLVLLNLGATKVTDKCTQKLLKLGGMRWLFLGNTGITNNAMKNLGQLNILEWLDLGGTAVTGDGLSYLGRSKSLSRLMLCGTKLSSRFLNQLTSCQSLKELDLAETKVTDAGIEQVATLGSLKILCLRSTKLTDCVVPFLVQIVSLRELNLYKTSVTQIGADVLKKSNPQLKIFRG